MPDTQIQLTVLLDPNPGLRYGQPLAPEGWLETGRWAMDPATGNFFGVEDLIPGTNKVNLHASQPGWQGTDTGKTVTAALALAPAPPVVVARAPAAASNANAPSFVPGRTRAQAIAMGDLWAVFADPAAG